MHDSNAIPEPLVRQLHEHFTDPELVELTFLIGYINMLNLFNNCLQVRYDGEYSLLKPTISAKYRLAELRVAPDARYPVHHVTPPIGISPPMW